jgi:hypothetical protein
MEYGDETDLHTLAGAYAMDAVGDADRARFEQHLAGCAPCREEIRGLREATARLALATAVQPRADLRDTTLRAAARTRQLPPAVSVIGPVKSPRRRLAGPLPRLALTAACALAAVVVVLATMMHGTQHRLDQAQLRSHAIAAVLTASDVTMLTAQVSTGGSATVLMSHQRHALVFSAQGLAALPAAQRYELWLMGPAGSRAAGLLPASGRMIGPVVVSGLGPGDKVGVTIEPAAGSRKPTSPPIVLLGLASQ